MSSKSKTVVQAGKSVSALSSKPTKPANEQVRKSETNLRTGTSFAGAGGVRGDERKPVAVADGKNKKSTLASQVTQPPASALRGDKMTDGKKSNGVAGASAGASRGSASKFYTADTMPEPASSKLSKVTQSNQAQKTSKEQPKAKAVAAAASYAASASKSKHAMAVMSTSDSASKKKKQPVQVIESETEESEDDYMLAGDDEEDYGFYGEEDEDGMMYGDEDDEEDGLLYAEEDEDGLLYAEEDEDGMMYGEAAEEDEDADEDTLKFQSLMTDYELGLISEEQLVKGLDELGIDPSKMALLFGRGDEDEDEDDMGGFEEDEDGFAGEEDDQYLEYDDDDEEEEEEEHKSVQLGSKRRLETSKPKQGTTQAKDSKAVGSKQATSMKSSADDDLDDLDDDEVYDFKIRTEAEEAEKEAQRLQEELREKQIEEYLARKREELKRIIAERQKEAHYRRLRRRALKKEAYNMKYSIKTTYQPYRWNK